jgi:hypothetical protein
MFLPLCRLLGLVSGDQVTKTKTIKVNIYVDQLKKYYKVQNLSFEFK